MKVYEVAIICFLVNVSLSLIVSLFKPKGGNTVNLYRVYNGFMANAALHVIVIAKDEKQAAALASDKFKADDQGGRHGERYWSPKRMEVELLCGDLANGFVSEIDEG